MGFKACRPGQRGPLWRYANLALLSLLSSGCANELRLDSGAAADLQRCGVDIEMSQSLRFRLLKDAQDRSLSIGSLREIKSTIFESVPPANRLAVYNSYVDCITSRTAFNAALIDITRRKVSLIEKLRSKYSVSPEDLRRIETFYEQESEQLRAGQLVAARDTRTAMIYHLTSIASRHNIRAEDIAQTGEGHNDGVRARRSHPAREFLDVCLTGAERELCQSMLSVFEDYYAGRSSLH